MVELNKQALLSWDAKDWQTAKDLLLKAIDEANAAGLESNNMTARTYLHLGAVYWVGFKDREAAIKNFAISKKIRPDIQLTPAIDNPDLKAVFDSATDEPEGGQPIATPSPQPRPAAPPPLASGPVTISDDGGDEPDLPASLPAPLMCTVPEVVPPKKALTIRCALQPGLNAMRVEVHYRPRGVEAFQSLGMRRTPKGWYIVTLPGNLMKKGVLQIYFDARDSSDNQVASNGQIDSPSVIAVRKGSSYSSGGDSEDPMKHIRDELKAEEYLAGLHRRREGAVWFGMGGGLGWGFVPAGSLEWERNVRVSALTTTTGSYHLLPEVGYMVSDNFGLALQGRLEFIQQQQAVYPDPETGRPVQLAASISGSPTTMAPAAFGRAIGYLDISSGGNLRFSYSADLGGGYVRFPVKPVAVVSQNANDQIEVDWNRTIAKTDTRPVGTFLLGATMGMLWNLSSHFGISLDMRVLSGLPHWGAVVEGGLSVQLAFGGQKGPAAASDDNEDDDEDDGYPYESAPPVDDYDEYE